MHACHFSIFFPFEWKDIETRTPIEFPTLKTVAHFAKITDGRTSPDLVLARLEMVLSQSNSILDSTKTIILPRTPLDIVKISESFKFQILWLYCLSWFIPILLHFYRR